MRIEDAIKQKEFTDPYTKAVVNLLFTQSHIVTVQSSLFKQFGLSPEQYNVLRILRGQKGNAITVSSIQERMLNRMSNASRLVEKLKRKEMVLRRECESDRRQVDVLITEKGLEFLQQIEQQTLTLNRQLIQLDENEVNQLNDLLDKLRG